MVTKVLPAGGALMDGRAAFCVLDFALVSLTKSGSLPTYPELPIMSALPPIDQAVLGLLLKSSL